MPTSGSSLSTGMAKWLRAGSACWVYGTPTKADSPAPSSDSASPVADWLVLSQITSHPSTPASSASARPMFTRDPATRRGTVVAASNILLSGKP